MNNKPEEILELQKEIVELDLAIRKLRIERNKLPDKLKELLEASN